MERRRVMNRFVSFRLTAPGPYALLLALLIALPASAGWERNYGTPDNTDSGFDGVQTTDGGYIVAGGTYSFGNENQVYLIKTDASGDTLWTRNYGGPDNEEAHSVRQTTDGGYIIAGFTGGQVYLVKTDASGVASWTRTYGGGGGDYGHSVRQTTDGGYIIAGSTDSYGNEDQFYLVKTNASGTLLWQKNYGGPDYEYAYSVQQTTDGGYIVAGLSTPFSGQEGRVYLVKTNASGDTLWTRTYGGPGWEYASSVQQTTDGGYVLTGPTSSFGTGGDVYLVKTDASGTLTWERNYGGPSGDGGSSVQQTTDGGYIVAGYTRSYGAGEADVYLVKTDASGDTLWTRTYGDTIREIGYSVQQTTDGGYIIAGYTSWSDRQVYLVKVDRISGVEEERVQGSQGPRVQGFKVNPNPFVSFATVLGHEREAFSLYDVSGRKVGTYRGDRVGEGLAPGVYFLRSSDSKNKPLRIVKVR
jgi:hypothetical protein